MSAATRPNRTARTTAERAIQNIYREALGEAFLRAAAEAASVADADLTLGDMRDIAGEFLVAEGRGMTRLRSLH